MYPLQIHAGDTHIAVKLSLVSAAPLSEILIQPDIV